MKQFIYIAILLFSVTAAQAQGIYRFGQGDEATNVVAVAKNQSAVSVIHVNESDEYELLQWDGFNYSDFGSITILPKHNQSSTGDFAVQHAIWFKNQLFVVGQYGNTDQVTNPVLVVTFDGTSWTI